MYRPERILQGAPNARDLGGLETGDGRRVKDGRLIRSGMLRNLTSSDVEYLERTRLRKVIDLRTTQEKCEKPNVILRGAEYVHYPVLPDRTDGITRELPKTPEAEAKRAIAMAQRLMQREEDGITQMRSMYPLFITLDHCAERFADIFDTLLEAEEGAVLFHCSMGKDRAGITAAMILYALGVPRDSITHDYLITNERCAEGTDRLIENCRGFTDDEKVLKFIRDLDAADKSFIDASFAAAEELYGGFDGFLRYKVGLSDGKRAKLREMYLI
ncbi:MAG: tyrosine-protein phosphatase [Oscillospiraceae bacterium]|nr:tyrosine-protein phosphatase [Oscillospiraceae bacterium]